MDNNGIKAAVLRAKERQKRLNKLNKVIFHLLFPWVKMLLSCLHFVHLRSLSCVLAVIPASLRP